MCGESLTLKFGTLKGWNAATAETMTLLEEYFAEGVTAGVMQQRDTDTQKATLCKIIEQVNGPIYNDWEGETMTPDEAKKYVMEYSK